MYIKSNFHKFYGNVRLGDQSLIGFMPIKEANENIWKLRLNQNSVNVRMVWGNYDAQLLRAAALEVGVLEENIPSHDRSKTILQC